MKVKDLLSVYKKGFFCIYEPVHDENGNYVDERYVADNNTKDNIMKDIHDREIDCFDVVESELVILLKSQTEV